MRMIFILFCVLPQMVSSQSLRTPIAARYIGLGAYSKNFVDAFSFTANQAALAQVKGIEVGIYGERRFLLDVTNLFTVVFVAPTKQGNMGIEASYFGFTNYNESELGVGYARSLGGKIDLGVKFNYYSIRIPGYGSASAVNFEIGTIAQLAQKVFAGFHIYNPVGGNLGKTNDKLRSAYKFGMGYEASDKFFVATEIIKEEDVPVNVNVGFQYNFRKQLLVRAGIATETTNTYIGAGFTWKNLRLDVTGSYHQQLGFSPGLMLLTNFVK